MSYFNPSKGNDISIKSYANDEANHEVQSNDKPTDYLFSIEKAEGKNSIHDFTCISYPLDQFYLKAGHLAQENKNSDIFLIVRSLKYDDGNQKVFLVLKPKVNCTLGLSIRTWRYCETWKNRIQTY